jgi:type I restriction enzyme S subunit
MFNGRAFKPTEWRATGLPIVRIQNLNNPNAGFNYCDPLTIDERHLIKDGEFLISWSGTPGTSFGAFIWQRGEGALNQHIFRCVQVGMAFEPRFLCLAINTQLDVLISQAQGGVGLQHVTKGTLEKLPLALPPLAEQHRIVAKVDELMALCNQLEAAQQERERRCDRLAVASLQRLNQPAADTTPEAQREHARFHLQHLPRLTIRPEHIKAIRQTILNLAVRGTLSDSNEWSLYSQPLKVAATLQNGYAFKSEWFAKTGIRLLRNINVSHGVIRWDELACLPIEQADEFERFKLLEGDIVLSLDRPFIGTGTKVARVRTNDLPCFLLQRVGRFQLNPDLLTSDYLFLWIESPQFTDQIDPGRSNGVPHISSKQVECAEIFLPPLVEQHRIVAKVDELMTLCDQLEAQLTTIQTDSSRLLKAVLEAVLVPA